MRDWSSKHAHDSYEKYLSERIRARDIIAISCWHRSMHESAAMWSLYEDLVDSAHSAASAQSGMNAGRISDSRMS
jgi:hypothetical protein